MAHLLVKFVTQVCALALVAAELNPLSDAFIDLINSKQNTWKAGRNFPEDTPDSYIAKLTGVLKGDHIKKLPNIEHNADLIASLPDKFDPREKWPNCPTLNEIRDQGSCGSCWAFGAVEAMTDRVCIYSNGTKQFHFSAEDLLSCCEDCGSCEGGYSPQAWMFWKDTGLVSGGNYNSRQGCRPYSVPTRNHTDNSITCNRIACTSEFPTPDCVKSCEVGYNVTYENDKKHGTKVFSVRGVDNIMAELYTNGPVEATFDVYGDFFDYKGGVYRHIEGNYRGGHAVKMMGWGVENGTKYWLIANSWNKFWGNNGFFKIVRGENHCNIENTVDCGEPQLDNIM